VKILENLTINIPAFTNFNNYFLDNSNIFHTFALTNRNTVKNMTTMTTTTIQKMLDTMSVEELKNRLAAYMMADENLVSRPIGVEVRLADTLDRSGRYDVLIVLEDGSEKEVKFRDRHSRLVYIYTLLHPQGYQRRSLRTNNFQALRDLFSRLYFGSAEPLMKAIGNDFDHYFSQAVAQSRRAIRETIGHSELFEIGLPQRHGGKTLVSCAANGGHVIIDSSLL